MPLNAVGSHGHPGLLFLAECLVLKGVKDDAVDADRECPIGLVLHIGGMFCKGIFAGGDVVTGPNTVTEAMAHGKIAAEMIDKHIRGEKLERVYTVTIPCVDVDAAELTEEEAKGIKKPEEPLLAVAERIRNFSEVEQGYSEADAILEAKRCLRCDLEAKQEE